MVAPIYGVTATREMPLFQLLPDPTISETNTSQSMRASRLRNG